MFVSGFGPILLATGRCGGPLPEAFVPEIQAGPKACGFPKLHRFGNQNNSAGWFGFDPRVTQSRRIDGISSTASYACLLKARSVQWDTNWQLQRRRFPNQHGSAPCFKRFFQDNSGQVLIWLYILLVFAMCIESPTFALRWWIFKLKYLDIFDFQDELVTIYLLKSRTAIFAWEQTCQEFGIWT